MKFNFRFSHSCSTGETSFWKSEGLGTKEKAGAKDVPVGEENQVKGIVHTEVTGHDGMFLWLLPVYCVIIL